MQRLSLNFAVGLFVLLGIFAIIFLAVKTTLNNDDFSLLKNPTYTLYAEFNNVGSLKISAPVKISGIVIGRVTNIALNPQNYQANVTLQIDKQVKLSTDTSAQILTTGLLGEQYVGLQSGADTSYLTNDSTISLTSSAIVLENLINKFMTNISGTK